MNHSPSIFLQIAVFCFCLLGLVACNRENTHTGSNPSIATSLDTLAFDTVFTALGSATKSFKIYNKESGAIEVDVRLEKGGSSSFRLNVDGTPGGTQTGVRIAGGDSIYVFADVTIDPDQPLSVSPFVLEENLLITSGSTTKKVLATAWGQNANYIPGRKKKGITSLLSCNLEEVTWDDPRPYVIYGLLLIDSCTLNIPQGTNIYVHGGIVTNKDQVYSDGGIFVGKNGRLVTQGSADQPVVFQGDRLEKKYDNIAGQWIGIRYLSESRGNKMEHTTIKNAIIGVRADSLASIDIDKVKIYNIGTSGIIGYHADIQVTNSLIYNTQQHSFIGVFGGRYGIKNSTFYNAGNNYSAIYGDDRFCFDQDDCENTTKFNPLALVVENSVAIGDKQEVAVLGRDESTVDFTFKNNYVFMDTMKENGQAVWRYQESCILGTAKDTIFLNRLEGDYSPDTMSVLIGKGYQNGILDDINDHPRDDSPDIGCYEFH